MAIESLESVKEKLNRKADTTRISLLFLCGFICFFLLIIYYEFRIQELDNSHPQDYSQRGHQALPTIITVLTV